MKYKDRIANRNNNFTLTRIVARLLIIELERNPDYLKFPRGKDHISFDMYTKHQLNVGKSLVRSAIKLLIEMNIIEKLDYNNYDRNTDGSLNKCSCYKLRG